MSKCTVSGDKHGFTFIPAEEPLFQYITCIACGERRAVTRKGELITYNDTKELWEEIQPSKVIEKE